MVSGGMGGAPGAWAVAGVAVRGRAIRNAMLRGRSMEDSLALAGMKRDPEQKIASYRKR
jgi:hypothetical protein